MIKKLVALRERLQRDGSWDDRDESFMYDVAVALGLSEIDAAYVAGDIGALYRIAQKKDREPWALTPEEWAEIPGMYFCAAVDESGARYAYRRTPKTKIGCWHTGFAGDYIMAGYVELPDGVDWKDTLTYRPGHEPQGG